VLKINSRSVQRVNSDQSIGNEVPI